MSQIKTTTSSARASLTPSVGEIYYESDTHRLIVWTSGAWQMYNRTSISNTTGGQSEINYPQGLFSNTSAPYYLSTSPVLHMDASRINGVDGTGQNLTNTELFWYDRTHNKHLYEETAFGPEINDVLSTTITSGNNSTPCVENNGKSVEGPNTAPKSVQGDVTMFWVIAPPDDGHISPFKGYEPWIVSPSAYRFMNRIHTVPSGGHPLTESRPILFVGRNSDSGNDVWHTYKSHTSRTRSRLAKSTDTCDISKIGHTYSNYIFEILVFDQALSIDDINKVKLYLEGKYKGLNDEYFPSIGFTADLTDV